MSYYHWLRDQRFDHPAVTLARSQDFAGFLRQPEVTDGLRAQPFGRYVVDAAGGGPGQSHPARTSRGRPRPASRRIWGSASVTSRVNLSDRDRDWRRYYGDSEAEIVRELCETDIKRFGYAFS
ncbi:MAG: hypothetical protein R3D59_09900 [Paracoccaceae bacterium]